MAAMVVAARARRKREEEAAAAAGGEGEGLDGDGLSVAGSDDECEEVDFSQMTWAEAVHRIMSDPSSSPLAFIINAVLLGLILVSVFVFCIETLRSLYREDRRPVFVLLEIILVAVFTLEYVVRLVVFPGRKLSFVFDGFNLVDLAAILPFYLELTLSSLIGDGVSGFAVIRVVRLVRVFRLSRYSPNFVIVIKTMRKSKDALLLVTLMLTMTVVVLSAFIYIAERGSFVDGQWVRPDGSRSQFQSVPDSFWWCIITMTTVGYGDQQPVTFWGRVIAVLTMFCGTLTFAFPITIVSANFTELWETRAKARKGRFRLRAAISAVAPRRRSSARSGTDRRVSASQAIENAAARRTSRQSRLSRASGSAAGPEAGELVELEEMEQAQPQPQPQGQGSQRTALMVMPPVLASALQRYNAKMREMRDTPLYSHILRTRVSVYVLFDDPASSMAALVLSILILVLILLSVVSFCVETLPELYAENGREPFKTIETVVVTVFTIEYLVRLITTFMPRIKFILQPLNLVDLLAILPFYLEFVIPANVSGLGVIRVVRLVRVFRIFRLSKYSNGFQVVAATIVKSTEVLSLMGFLILIGVILFSSLVYYAEAGRYDSEREIWFTPGGSVSDFQSIPESFYWAVITVSTVGYGDAVPTTILGRFVGSFAALCGVLILAFPITILGNNFADEWELNKIARRIEEEVRQREERKEKLDRERRERDQQRQRSASPPSSGVPPTPSPQPQPPRSPSPNSLPQTPAQRQRDEEAGQGSQSPRKRSMVPTLKNLSHIASTASMLVTPQPGSARDGAESVRRLSEAQERKAMIRAESLRKASVRLAFRKAVIQSRRNSGASSTAPGNGGAARLVQALSLRHGTGAGGATRLKFSDYPKLRIPYGEQIQRARFRVHLFMSEPMSSRWSLIVSVAILVVIVFSVILFCVETMYPDDEHRDVFFPMSIAVVTLFTVEYLVRLLTAPRLLQWAMQWLNIIDFVAILPFYLSLAADSTAQGLAIVRVVRLVRVFRVFRLGSYARSFRIVTRVLSKNRDALSLLLFLVTLEMVLFSSLMYFAERGSYDEDRKLWFRTEDGVRSKSPFQSVLHTFYWTIITMTTCGYGDQYPLQLLGKLVASVTAVCGILTLAFPITIIGNSFAEEWEGIAEDSDDAGAGPAGRDSMASALLSAAKAAKSRNEAASGEGAGAASVDGSSQRTSGVDLGSVVQALVAQKHSDDMSARVPQTPVPLETIPSVEGLPGADDGAGADAGAGAGVFCDAETLQVPPARQRPSDASDQDKGKGKAKARSSSGGDLGNSSKPPALYPAGVAEPAPVDKQDSAASLDRTMSLIEAEQAGHRSSGSLPKRHPLSAASSMQELVLDEGGNKGGEGDEHTVVSMVVAAAGENLSVHSGMLGLDKAPRNAEVDEPQTRQLSSQSLGVAADGADPEAGSGLAPPDAPKQSASISSIQMESFIDRVRSMSQNRSNRVGPERNNSGGSMSGDNADGSLRTRLDLFLNDSSSSRPAFVFSIAILIMILFSIVVFCLETLPEFHEDALRRDSVWSVMEKVVVSVFTAEYGLRLIVSRARLRFVRDPSNVIDLVSIIPFYLELAAGLNVTAVSVIRSLRIARVFRVFKLSRYSTGFQTLVRTIKRSVKALLLLVGLFLIGMVFFAALMYFAERGNFDAESGEWIRPGDPDGVASPFQSIPRSFWWAVVTLTTVGYGIPWVPITALGQLVAVITALTGVLVLAFPIAIIGGAFAEENDKQEK